MLLQFDFLVHIRFQQLMERKINIMLVSIFFVDGTPHNYANFNVQVVSICGCSVNFDGVPLVLTSQAVASQDAQHVALR